MPAEPLPELTNDPIRRAIIQRMEVLGIKAHVLADRMAESGGPTVSHDVIYRYLQGTRAPAGGKLLLILQALGWDERISWTDVISPNGEKMG